MFEQGEESADNNCKNYAARGGVDVVTVADLLVYTNVSVKNLISFPTKRGGGGEKNEIEKFRNFLYIFGEAIVEGKGEKE